MQQSPPKPGPPTSLSCPQCKKTNFVSFGALRDHFTAKKHPCRCGTCHRDFKTVEGALQHFQKHAPQVESNKPNTTVPTKASKGTQTDLINRADQTDRAIQTIQAAQGSTTKKAAKSQTRKDGNVSLRIIKAIKDTNSAASTMNPRKKPKDAEILPADVGPCETNPVLLYPPEQEKLYRLLANECHGGSRLYAHGYTVPWNVKSTKKQRSKGSVAVQDFIVLPNVFEGTPGSKKLAIVLDCEMVEVAGGRREVAFLTALDFLSGEILINHYIQPRSKVTAWNSRYSGVTPGALNRAMRTGNGITWNEARARLCILANTETVLIGHALNNDLDVLGIIHLNIVDSCLLTCEAVYPDWSFEKPLPRTWGLKNLTKELLGYDIQTSKLGHSALEDAYATREVVIWCITQRNRLKDWAQTTRKIEDIRQAEIQRKREEEREKKLAEVKKREEEAKRRQEEEAKKKAQEEQSASVSSDPVLSPALTPLPSPIQAPAEMEEKSDEDWADIGEEFVPLV